MPPVSAGTDGSRPAIEKISTVAVAKYRHPHICPFVWRPVATYYVQEPYCGADPSRLAVHCTVQHGTFITTVWKQHFNVPENYTEPYIARITDKVAWTVLFQSENWYFNISSMFNGELLFGNCAETRYYEGSTLQPGGRGVGMKECS